MVEIKEYNVEADVTSTLIDTTEVHGYSCWVKGLYQEGKWQPLGVWPCMSSESSYEAFREECKKQVIKWVTSDTPKYVTLKFCKVVL